MVTLAGATESRARGWVRRGGVGTRRRLPLGFFSKFGRDFDGLGHTLDISVHALALLGKRNALARMEAAHEPIPTIGSSSCDPMRIAWGGQQPGRASGPASTKEAHSMVSFGHNTMGAVNNSPKAVLLPDRMSSKVDARFRVGGVQFFGTGDNGAKLTAKSPAPLLPLVWVNDVDTFALSIERPGLMHDVGVRMANSNICLGLMTSVVFLT